MSKTDLRNREKGRLKLRAHLKATLEHVMLTRGGCNVCVFFRYLSSYKCTFLVICSKHRLWSTRLRPQMVDDRPFPNMRTATMPVLTKGE